MKVAICDDDQFYIDSIRKKVIDKFNISGMDYIISEFTSGNEILERVKNGEVYDILFLDIDLNGQNGIEVAHTIRGIINDVIIIFVTSFIQYCPQGYEVNALRYILKDNRIFDKVLDESIKKAVEEYRKRDKTIKLKDREGIKEFKLEDILYIESSNHTLTVNYIYNGKIEKYSIRGKLDELEKIIMDKRFCRTHKSYLVNMDYVEFTRRYTLGLAYDIELNISKSRYEDVLMHR